MRTLLRALLAAVALTGMVTALVVTGGAAAALAAAPPTVYAVPNPSGPGDQVTLVGLNFCADPACSPVTVTAAGRQVATGVKVGSDGRFSADFRLSQPPGDYQVTASQQTPTGDQSAATRLRIAPVDRPPSTASGGGAGSGTRPAGGGATAPGTPRGGATTAPAGASAAGSTAGQPRAADPAGGGRGSGWVWFAVAAGVLLLAAGGGTALWRARRSGAAGG